MNFYIFQNSDKVWYEAKIEPYSKNNAILIANDISSKRLMEDKLQKEIKNAEYKKALLNSIIDSTPDLISIKDRSFKYIFG